MGGSSLFVGIYPTIAPQVTYRLIVSVGFLLLDGGLRRVKACQRSTEDVTVQTLMLNTSFCFEPLYACM